MNIYPFELLKSNPLFLNSILDLMNTKYIIVTNSAKIISKNKFPFEIIYKNNFINFTYNKYNLLKSMK